MKRLFLCLTMTVTWLAHNAEAAISVGPAGSGLLVFDAFPTVADGWSTLTTSGGSADIADANMLDANVGTNEASAITLPLGSSATTAPSISANPIARWNSNLQLLQTVPTSVGYVSLLATVRNDTGADQSALTLIYDLGELHAVDTTVVEEVPAHRVYYSLTGVAGSWQLIPELSSVEILGTLVATLNLSSWPNGSLLYILWADDNANAARDNANNEEGGYTLDNISFLPGTPSRAISVGPAGSGTLTFDAFPNVVEGWATLINSGTGADIADDVTLDASAQTNLASALTHQLGNSLTATPSISASSIARWHRTLHLIETVPTGVGYVSLLATLQNDTGTDQSALTITYDLGELHAAESTVVEEIPAHRVYYSLTGDANSWQLIPDLSSVGSPGTLTAALSLGSWPNGSRLYLLWLDDNADADRNNLDTEEGGYTIDNISFTPGTIMGARITGPTNGQSFAQGLPITINAVASLDRTVMNVAFYTDGSLIGEDAMFPFSAVYSNATLGTHNLTAVATDDLGGTVTSSVVQITIVPGHPPSVTLTEPAEGASFLVGLNVTNRASASETDPGDGIARVEFYVDGGLFVTDLTSPYSFELCDIVAGAHSISAVAVDNAGSRATNTLSITATNPPPEITILVPNGSSWKYLDDGSNQDVLWRDALFDDSSWNEGVAELGYGDVAQNRPERTALSFGPDANAKYPTTYFRKTFTVADPAVFGNLIVRLLRDDGGIVYINGTEVFRSGITIDPVDFSTYTPPAAADDGTVYQEANASPSVLVQGPNVVGVEIHQDAANSSDISFDLMLWGEGPQAPILTITPISPTQADISWPFPSTDYVLEAKIDLNAPMWDLVTELDLPDASFHHVTVDTSTGKRFFRLQKPIP